MSGESTDHMQRALLAEYEAGRLEGRIEEREACARVAEERIRGWTALARLAQTEEDRAAVVGHEVEAAQIAAAIRARSDIAPPADRRAGI